MYTQEQLEAMSGPELAQAFNQLTGSVVKRFASRKDGIRRILEEQGTAAPTTMTTASSNVTVSVAEPETSTKEEKVPATKSRAKKGTSTLTAKLARQMTPSQLKNHSIRELNDVFNSLTGSRRKPTNWADKSSAIKAVKKACSKE